MPRLFVAVDLPDSVRDRLEDLVYGLPGARWTPREQMHVTLRFVGDVDGGVFDDLRAALGEVSPPAFAMRLKALGHFPPRGEPHVLWAGVTPEPALELLQHGVEQAFEPLGFPTEGRAFRPHVTLGRTARDARPRDLAGLEAAFAQIPFDRTVTISELDLMQSTLRPDGPVYQVKYHERLS